MYKEKEFNFDKYWAFFAFGKNQLEEWLKGEDLFNFVTINFIPGLVARRENYKEMLEDLENHYENERKKRLKIEWKEKVILYELRNHECFYVWEVEERVFEVLALYWITKEEVLKVFNEVKERESNN